MKKIIQYSSILIFSVFLINSCQDMDETYRKYIEDGPIVYLANLPNLSGHSGYGRAELSWDKLTDPRAKFVNIYWNNFTDSIVHVTLDPSQGGSIIIDNLEEGDYAFNVEVRDDLGHYSLKKEILTKSYGELYKQYLVNRNVDSCSYNPETGGLFVKFSALAAPTVIGTNVMWDGGSTLVPNKKDSLTIPDFKIGTSIVYNTAYLPDTTCIDIVTSENATYRPQIEVPLVASQLSCDKPSTLLGRDIGALLDGNSSTYFSTNKSAEFPHNITISLNQQLTGEFKFYYKTRPGSYSENNPADIILYVSETGTDNSWTQLDRITTATGLPTTEGGSYTSNWYSSTTVKIKYIRLAIMETNSEISPNACFLDELRIYQ